MSDRISDLDRQIAADPRHPASSALQRAFKAEAELAASRRENATLREAAENYQRQVAANPWNRDERAAEAALLDALVASPATEEPQP